MNITTEINANRANLILSGKITVQTAPELEDAVLGLPDTIADIDLDLTDIDYISSAGLRVFVLTSRQAQRRGGVMRLLHPDDAVVEVLEMTGLTDIFNIVR